MSSPTRFRLTALDEWPRHQTGATFDVVANESPHWSDGFYFTLGDNAGEVIFIMGFRLYPNNDVLDAFVAVSVADPVTEVVADPVTDAVAQQHNMRWSRRLRPAIDDLTIGPLSVEIVEGLRNLRIVCDRDAARAAGYELGFELDWRGIHAPYLEDHLVQVRSGRLISERSNFDQACGVTGTLTVGDRTWAVGPGVGAGWIGVRDHSWGVGSTGGAKHPDAAPMEREPLPGLRMWVVAAFADRTMFWQVHHDGERASMWESQVIAPYGSYSANWSYDDSPDAFTYDFTWRTDPTNGAPVPRLDRGEVTIRRTDGGADRFRIEVVSPPVYCLGGGYFNGFDDHRGRGVYRGDLHHEGEVWDVSHPTHVIDPKGIADPRVPWAETWGRFTNLDDPADVGYGHLECVILGPHPDFPR